MSATERNEVRRWDEVPLTTLVAWLWIALTMEVDNAVEVAGLDRVGRAFRISLAMWTNGLRFIDEDGVSVGQLQARARSACNIGGLERWGWISVGDNGGGGNDAAHRTGFGTRRGVTADTVLRPTRAGAFARRLWPTQVGAIEEAWRVRFGHRVIETLVDALETRSSESMPRSPPEVHPSDGFLTHIVDGDGQADAGRPLVALLGQVLTALTLEQERTAEVSLPLAANALRAIDHEIVRTRDLPARTGLSREGMAMATSFLTRRDLGVTAPQHAIRLSPIGLDALDGYRLRAGHVRDDTLRAALEAVVSQTGALAAGLLPPEGGWRSQRPYLTQSERLVADPIGALPWHPMVLHRGGWPDAS